jgi:hypothetical protein
MTNPFILDKAELLVQTKKDSKRWKSSLYLPSETLEKKYATKAILRLSIGAHCEKGPALSQLFIKPSDISARLGCPEFLVARATGYKTLVYNSSMTIINLDVDSSFDYGFVATMSTSPVFVIQLVGYYI